MTRPRARCRRLGPLDFTQHSQHKHALPGITFCQKHFGFGRCARDGAVLQKSESVVLATVLGPRAMLLPGAALHALLSWGLQ